MESAQIISSLGNLCSVGSSLFGSTFSLLWSIITFIGFWKSSLVLLLVIIWIVWELNTIGTHRYNSENGLTRVFNSFIGASAYFWLQSFIYFFLEILFSEGIYCFKWPYVLHALVFLLTGLLLNILGVWKYWKLFGEKVRIR